MQWHWACITDQVPDDLENLIPSGFTVLFISSNDDSIGAVRFSLGRKLYVDFVVLANLGDDSTTAADDLGMIHGIYINCQLETL